MKPKAKLKIAVDVLMTLGLLFLMGYQLWGDVAHEWAGAGMFVLFILHHALNGAWYRGIAKGKYTPARVLQLVIDLLVFLSMAGLMVSGVILSTHVFAFLPISGGTGFARILHMAVSHWGFVLMSLHLGLHWGMFVEMARKALSLRPSRTRQVLFNLLGAGVTVYGLTAFLRRDLLTYMLVRTQFVFLDFSEPILQFYLDYLAMMGAFIFLAHSVSRILRRQRKPACQPVQPEPDDQAQDIQDRKIANG